MELIRTPQGKYDLYLFDIGNKEPRGIETTAIVLSNYQLDELFTLLKTHFYSVSANQEYLERQLREIYKE